MGMEAILMHIAAVMSCMFVFRRRSLMQVRAFAAFIALTNDIRANEQLKDASKRKLIYLSREKCTNRI